MPYQKSSVSDPGRGKSLAGFEYCHQYSNTTGDVPTAAELKVGELAVNTADGKVFFKKPNGTISSIPSGLSTQINIEDINSTIHVLSFSNGLLVGYDTP
jgi:hypothetical protein